MGSAAKAGTRLFKASMISAVMFALASVASNGEFTSSATERHHFDIAK